MSLFVDFKTLKRSRRPNSCLVAPVGLCEVSDIDRSAPIFADSPSHLYERIEKLVVDTKRWQIEASDTASGKIHFIATSKIMRFKDDVYIQVLPDEAGSTLAIYSRSRVGYSDGGVNARRVEGLLKSLTVA